jgi:DNA-binding NarL/FixJ family response regulator
MAQGKSNLAIADQLVLSPRTIESHVGSVFDKLGLNNTPDDHRRVLAVLAYLKA